MARVVSRAARGEKTSHSRVTGRLSNRLYLPREVVTQKVLKQLSYTFWETETVEEIDEDGEIQFVDKRVRVDIDNFRIKGDRIGLHRGRLALLRKLLPKYIRWEDCRADVPMQIKLRMRNDPRYNQQACFDDFQSTNGGGIVIAPTAWGKTYFGIFTGVMLDQRVLVLASRTNWCANWLKDIRKHTNLPKMEKALGRPLAGILKPSKMKSADEVFPCFNVCTPQAFMSKRGRKMLKKLQHSFGLVIFDEAVMLPGEETSKVFTTLNPLWRMGLSADETRKDKKHKLTYDYVGPVVATGVRTGDNASAQVETHYTGTQINAQYLGPHWFGGLCSQLARRKARNDLIATNMIRDVIDGWCVLGLVDRRQQAVNLYNMLRNEVIPIPKSERKAAKGKRGKRMKTRPLRVEVLMGGDKKQLEKIAAAGRREYDVLIAMDKAVGMNTDMPGIDCVHDPSPTTNIPLLKQRTGRALRECYHCPDCGEWHSSAMSECSACGSLKVYNAKRWPVKIVTYKDEATPEESRAGKFLIRGWQVRMDFYQGRDYSVPDTLTSNSERPSERRKARDSGKSFIKRRKRG